jgi:hypothetical protein
MFVHRSGQNEQSLERTFHRCFHVYHFRAFWLDKSTVTCLFLIRSYLDEHFAITWCPSSFVH